MNYHIGHWKRLESGLYELNEYDAEFEGDHEAILRVCEILDTTEFSGVQISRDVCFSTHGAVNLRHDPFVYRVSRGL